MMMIAYQENLILTFDVIDSSCIPHVVFDFEDFLKKLHLLDFWVDDFPNIPFGGICDRSLRIILPPQGVYRADY